ncbi:hypothetical protein ACN27G_06155 [Plantactinospora sp. WMMB334]|uniref:hypothetical protein n=1 Tax=Plantactinospora sp. WMMB334 TaxID=3404119 RepID=UPI003B93E6F6
MSELSELLLWLLMVAFGVGLLVTPAVAMRPVGRHERRQVDARRTADEQVSGLRPAAGEPHTLAAGTVYGTARWVDPAELAAAEQEVPPGPVGPVVGRVATEPCEETPEPVYRGRHGAPDDVDEPPPDPPADPAAGPEPRSTAAGVNPWFAAHLAAHVAGWRLS